MSSIAQPMYPVGLVLCLLISKWSFICCEANSGGVNGAAKNYPSHEQDTHYLVCLSGFELEVCLQEYKSEE